MGIISTELFLPTDWRTTVELTRASIIGSVGLSWCRAITGSDRAARSSKPSRPGSSIRPQLIHAAGPSPHACTRTRRNVVGTYKLFVVWIEWSCMHVRSSRVGGWMSVRSIMSSLFIMHVSVRPCMKRKRECVWIHELVSVCTWHDASIHACVPTRPLPSFLPKLRAYIQNKLFYSHLIY
jgi:hypothetical protein